jgi:hypothetical protein
MFGSFFLYLVIPRGLKRQLCNAYPKRYARSDARRMVAATEHEKPMDSKKKGRRNLLRRHYQSIPTDLDRLCSAKASDCSVACVEYEYGHECAVLGSNRRENWFSPEAGSSICSSPPRISSNGHRMVNFGTTDTPDNPRVDSTKKLVVLVSRGCLDETQHEQSNEALSLLRSRKVPFEVVDEMKNRKR